MRSLILHATVLKRKGSGCSEEVTEDQVLPRKELAVRQEGEERLACLGQAGGSRLGDKVEPSRGSVAGSLQARRASPAWTTCQQPSPASTHVIIFFQTRYRRESRYLQISTSMSGWTGSGSMVQKSLEGRTGHGVQGWGQASREWAAGPVPLPWV